MSHLVEMNGVCKSFGPTRVLKDVDFRLEAGSVHALMGENGAGKSTLMKVLSGVIQPTSGNIRIKGRTVHVRDPKQAGKLGVSTIFQEFTLIPNLTVAENMFLGHEPRRWDGSIDKAAVFDRARRLLADVFPAIRAEATVETLAVAEQQAVEIAKGLTANADIFVFDEPTAALNSADAEHLFKVIANLKAAGKGVVYISHRMAEVFALSDTITVMKDGASVRSAPTASFDLNSLVSTMVGRELQKFFPPRSSVAGPVALSVSNLRISAAAADVSIDLRRGEILGLAGLEGQGQREIMRAACGVEPLPGAAVARGHGAGRRQIVEVANGFSAAIDAGIGFIPEDRKAEGLFLSLPIADNISLGKQLNRSFLARAWHSKSALAEIIQKLRVAAADPMAPVGKLSGGNQQKVLLARWLLSGVDVLVIEEPTRGVDVGAKSEIYRLLREFTENGGAVLVSSRELVEIIGLCDRILVVHDHHVVADVPAEGATEEGLLKAAFSSQAGQLRFPTPTEGLMP